MKTKPQETVDLATFTEEIPNRKLHFLCCDGRIFWKVITKKTFFKRKTVCLFSLLILFLLIVTNNSYKIT